MGPGAKYYFWSGESHLLHLSWAVKRWWFRNQYPCTIYLDTSLKNWASFLEPRREGNQGSCVMVWYDTGESFGAALNNQPMKAGGSGACP